MSDMPSVETELWGCFDCGYTESTPFEEIAGQKIKKTVGEGRRERVIETAVCPQCKSEDWHSKGVAESLLNHEIEAENNQDGDSE